MPMGAVTAFSGISGCMSILHGSQGCSTYIRRHMATHYNEPVDIASSSLSEQGTVFGGENHLVSGIENLIRLYDPEVIAISTTCLAETIGEDTKRIVDSFRETHPDERVRLVTVASPGYGGTEAEGFFAATRALVETFADGGEKGDHINVVTPHISPEDTRWLKSLLASTGLSFVLLPDISESLDGGFANSYERLKKAGTTIHQIESMGRARATIELSEYCPDKLSAGTFLADRFGVPMMRLSLPIGIEATDALLDQLTKLGGRVSAELGEERRRYLDATVDAHKHIATARVGVFGTPDFAGSVVRLCAEIGAVPSVAATGSACPDFKWRVLPAMREAAARHMSSDVVAFDEADFHKIATWCDSYHVNLLIGSSEAHRIAQERGIPLIRAAFPIHDHLGGQRVRTLGFAGSMFLLDSIANAMIDRVHASYRKDLAALYLPETKNSESTRPESVDLGMNEKIPSEKSTGASAKSFASFSDPVPEISPEELAEKTSKHPCFSCSACGSHARMHLPVAPACNIRCNYCVRKYDCPNESRPGVTTEVLKPEDALAKFLLVKKAYPNLSVVGIAGPGDALADFAKTRESLALIRAADPEITFCLSTNGLMLPHYVDDLIRLGVTHITVTMNAVDPAIGAKIVGYVDYFGIRLEGVEAATVLLANQRAGIRAAVARGAAVKVNCVAIKGINEDHLFEVTRTAKELGAFVSNIMPHIAVEGSVFENLPRLNNKELEKLRSTCEVNINQMRHCRQCRADAIGTLAEDTSIDFRDMIAKSSEKETESATRVAAATKNGRIVDLHFGHADAFHIYESDGKTVRFIEKRDVERYCSGVEDCDEHENRIDKIVRAVSDCSAVLAIRIGDSPKRKLTARGIRTFMTYDRVESAVLSAVRKM